MYYANFFIFKFIKKCRMIMDNARTIFKPIIQTGALKNLEGTNVVPA